MNKKRRIQLKVSASEFSRLSGTDTFEIYGGSNCVIVRALTQTKKSIPSPKYAYLIYNLHGANNGDIRVKTTCGVQNCVTREHLIAEYFPNTKDKEYIDTYYKIDGVEQLAHNLKVPVDLLEKYIAKKK